MTPREVCRRIERLGGRYVEGRGSHRRYYVEYGDGQVCSTQVSMHRRDLKTGTWHGIEKDLAPAFGEGWLRR